MHIFAASWSARYTRSSIKSTRSTSLEATSSVFLPWYERVGDKHSKISSDSCCCWRQSNANWVLLFDVHSILSGRRLLRTCAPSLPSLMTKRNPPGHSFAPSSWAKLIWLFAWNQRFLASWPNIQSHKCSVDQFTYQHTSCDLGAPFDPLEL